MERIGEYTIARLVGEGGMGRVYEAEERLTGRKVALKVLRPELGRSEEGRRMFLSEMQILARIEHPALVRSLACFEDGETLVLVLELLRGRTLRDELRRVGRLPWATAVAVAARIAEGLAVAHGHGSPVVHRDLKPENVMLVVGDDDEPATAAPRGVKLMDFGVAKVLEDAASTATRSVGTLAYMSPEQIDARPLDGRSDLYALGLVLYEMLAGEAPFRSSSPRELLNLQCTATAPELPDDARRGLPRAVESLVFALLEKEPDARPATAADVLRVLGPIVAAGGEGFAAASSPPPASPRAASSSPSSSSSAAAASAERETDAPAASSSRGSASTGGAPRPGDTTRSAGSEPVARLDTLALVEGKASSARRPERSARPAAVSRDRAALVVLLASVLAFGATYGVRVATSRGEAALSASASPLAPSPLASASSATTAAAARLEAP